jgi:FkbH-like protein
MKEAAPKASSVPLRVAATFSAATLEPTLRFWIDALELPFELEVAPPGPLVAALVGSGEAAPPAHGLVALVLRVEDWEDAPAERARAHADELVRALAAPGPSRLLLFAPPSLVAAADPERAARHEAIESAAVEALAGTGATVVTSRRVRALYPVDQPDDPYGQRLARSPYSAEAAAAIATVLVREARALFTPAAKVVAVDCDDTLWGGVAAEAGPRGVVLDASRRAFGAALAAEARRGRLVCLCSRNDEADVWAVFDAREELPLRREHVTAAQIDWTTKSSGLRRLGATLGLSLDSFVFVDDSPLEVAEVRSRAPEVLAVQLPSSPAALARCLDHVWALDGAAATAESAGRAAAYASEAARERLRERAPSYARYFESLELVVDTAPASAHDRARVSELTYRTSQMNCSGRRRTLAELQAALESGELECRVTRVADRFGDYGLVGVALVRAEGDALGVDTLLLSCRALGRGVEHRMLADLGHRARERGLVRVVVPFVATARNRPAQHFLEAVMREDGVAASGARLFALEAEAAAAVRFDPEAVRPGERLESIGAGDGAPAAPLLPHPLLARIPHELADAGSIAAAVDAWRARRAAATPRGPLSREPRTAVERVLSAVWREALGVPVGADDSFFEAGGDSIHAVRLALLVRERLGVELPLAAIFESPSVSALAQRLSAEGLVVESEMRALLDEIDRLSDEEVSAALQSESGDEAAAGPEPVVSRAPAAARVSAPREAAPDAAALWDACGAFSTEPEPGPIGAIGVVTAGRPDALRRVVASWREHLESVGRSADLVVSDDSVSPLAEAECRAVLADAARGWPGALTYVGRPARARLVDRLAARGVPPSAVAFGLLDPLAVGHTSGAARNALTLATLGRLVLSVDDDTVCQPSGPRRPVRGVALRAGRAPGDVWTFDTRREAVKALPESAGDVLAAHERMLGRAAGSVVRREAGGPGGVVIGDGAGEVAARTAGGGRVALTVSGLVGDCAWGAPFGFWRHPLGLLLLEGASLEPLLASLDAYRAITGRREIARVVDRPTLADDAGGMTTFVGIDNRDGLPPFAPVRRGQDLVLGATLWHATSSLYGHVPVALLHAPPERRPFARGEILRTAGALDTAKLLLAVIDIASRLAPGGGLAALGRAVAELGTAAPDLYEARLRSHLADQASRHAALVERAIDDAPRAAAWWAEDLRAFVARERAAADGPEATVPLDLVEGRSVEGARELSRRLVRQFGELLEWWPEIARAVAELARSGDAPPERW